MKTIRFFLGMALVAFSPLSLQAADSAPQEVRIEASDFQFKASALTLHVGQPVVLTLVNKGHHTHEFESDLFQGGETRIESDGVTTVGDGIQEVVFAPGKSVTVRFMPRKAGNFPFACNAEKPEDHSLRGMKGVIQVK